jgi:type IX secretion system PorP/SprF family membrane protein
MNKVILAIFLLIAHEGTGQQVAQYTHYVFNQFGINPAVAGSKECIDLRFGYRTQWVGLTGAPKTALFNGHGRLKFRRAKNYRIYHGVGLMVENDVMGPFSRTMINLAYAYHMPVSSKYMLSFGLFGGIEQFRFNGADLLYVSADDPAISDAQSAKIIVPEFAPGIFLYSDNLFAGFTIRQLLRNRLKHVGTQSRLTLHYLFTAGKRFSTDNGLSIIPSAMLKFAPMATPAVDLNVMFDYRNKIAAGIAVRNVDAVAFLAKINFLRHFSLAYSYDVTTSRIRLGSSNTHELMLGIYACPLSGASTWDCPVFQ